VLSRPPLRVRPTFGAFATEDFFVDIQNFVRRDKMKVDRRELLQWLEQERRQKLLSEAGVPCPPLTSDSAKM
jgi:hypothetical protein